MPIIFAPGYLADILTLWHSDKPSEMEGFPMKSWNIEVYILDEMGNEKPATCFTKVTYNLHPSFANPTQS
jgi:transcription initiation factor IIF auxiliary subunit